MPQRFLHIGSLIFCLLFIGLFLNPAFSQVLTELEKQRSKKEHQKIQLQKDIDLTSKILSETSKNKSASLNQLQLLNKQISIRKRLIIIMNSEIKVLNKQIDEIYSIINSLENDLKTLKDEYANMIYFAYKNRSSYTRLMFLFSSKNFNQAYKRIKYIQQYSHYRQRQVELIEKTQEMLTNKVSDLEHKKNEKNDLLASKRKEAKKLKEEKHSQGKLVFSLKKKEAELKKELRKKQIAAQRLTKAIEDIIKKEIEARKKKAEITLTPEALKLSADFESNKGKLPWPVHKGVITGTFGTQPHPILKGIMINNNGIDIKTNKGSRARAVFEGEVTGVVAIPGAQNAVIIRHGEYLTVYSNLKKVLVKRGDKIKIKEDLGIVYTDSRDGNTEVHFELWKNTSKLNPTGWIYIK